MIKFDPLTTNSFPITVQEVGSKNNKNNYKKIKKKLIDIFSIIDMFDINVNMVKKKTNLITNFFFDILATF